MSFEEDTQPIVEPNENEVQVRVYHKRWYILAVFSILGILQVSFLVKKQQVKFVAFSTRKSSEQNSRKHMKECQLWFHDFFKSKVSQKKFVKPQGSNNS